jgi:glycogen debranching enzyme
MAKITNQCYLKAIKILKKNSTKFGFRASFKYYNSIWARDGAITILGAVLTGDNNLLEVSRKTLETLKNYQNPVGQIPNVFLINIKSPKYYALDANSWWVIGVEKYFSVTRDKKFLAEFWPGIKKAMEWLRYQIRDISGLIDAPEASDWMDSSVGRRGKVFYTNCLYWKAIDSANKLAKAIGEKEFDPAPYLGGGAQDLTELKRRINLLFWPQPEGKNLLYTWHSGFFEEAIHPWREHYTNYLSFEYLEDRCDVLANILAILFGIANREKKKKILKYFLKKQISNPYPVKVLNPPIFYPNPTWNPKVDLYREKQYQNLPFCYHNAGIWPYVGGFYILMLVKVGQREKAKEELEKLALANRLGKKTEWEFNEWLDGKSGEPKGATFQSWSAAGYIMAYQAVKEGKIIL